MSRIEQALEKATKLRDSKPEAKTPGGKVSDKEGTPDIGLKCPFLVTLNDAGSLVSEEYRKLKSMVVKHTKHGGFKNTIMVTSAVGGEGKSITAINLAVTLSQEYDHTVLLIDADLRNPSLQTYLDVTSESGLADCLTDGIDIKDSLLTLWKGGLTFLPPGKKVKNPAELLASQRMRTLLEDIKHRYSDRYIVIDTPPVLPFAETFSISSMVDGIVFVVKEGLATVENVREALDILKGGNLLGIVYNDVDRENLDGHYGYYLSDDRYKKAEKGI